MRVVLKGRSSGRWLAKRQAESGWQNPCPVPQCPRERGLGLPTCRVCDKEVQKVVAQLQGEVTAA